MPKPEKTILAFGVVSLIAVLLSVSAGMFVPSAEEANQANVLVKAIAPLANADDQRVFGAARFSGFDIEVFGVVDPEAQERIAAKLKAEMDQVGVQRGVKLRFYRHFQLREVAKQGAWTEREVVKSGLLREVIFP